MRRGRASGDAEDGGFGSAGRVSRASRALNEPTPNASTPTGDARDEFQRLTHQRLTNQRPTNQRLTHQRPTNKRLRSRTAWPALGTDSRLSFSEPRSSARCRDGFSDMRQGDAEACRLRRNFAPRARKNEGADDTPRFLLYSLHWMDESERRVCLNLCGMWPCSERSPVVTVLGQYFCQTFHFRLLFSRQCFLASVSRPGFFIFRGSFVRARLPVILCP